jgi:hypothetical protein
MLAISLSLSLSLSVCLSVCLSSLAAAKSLILHGFSSFVLFFFFEILSPLCAVEKLVSQFLLNM